ncbi:glycosyltransferase [Streptomyces uncialis]|uniref:glycosyltransferase n=1 Tax=Streptomyces uncialis TaxID=1048205 RepID=UPI002257458C|nr:glycosyltransferase [Streptomyces uncialis]MCX4662345.1 glycosyltransferase [Streptomyces uncialis]
MTAGSRGDVAPFTGLGHGLALAGHEVTLVTHARFAPLAARAGLDFRPLPLDPRAVLASAKGQDLHRSGSGIGKMNRLFALVREQVGALADDLLAAAGHSDVLLLAPAIAPLGHAVADGLGLPAAELHLQPQSPTRVFAPPLLGARSFGPLGNRLGAHAVNAGLDRLFADSTRALRARLGAPPVGVHAARRTRDRRLLPVHHGFSPLLVPRPRDWRPGLTVDGYWWSYDPPDAELPDEVAKFLDAGPPPVYVGLGSATAPDPERLSATIVGALRAAGLRGVIQRGWSGLAADGDDMLTVGELPHSVLFPRTAAVVHHAGAGTTAAALRAGVPSVPLPVQFDAAFWSARLRALGVASDIVPLRTLTERPGSADRLTAALVRATAQDSTHRTRARALAARLAGEDGVLPVARTVERLAARR